MTPKLRQLNASILGQTAVAWLAAWLWPLLLLAPFGGPMAVFFWGYLFLMGLPMQLLCLGLYVYRLHQPQPVGYPTVLWLVIQAAAPLVLLALMVSRNVLSIGLWTLLNIGFGWFFMLQIRFFYRLMQTAPAQVQPADHAGARGGSLNHRTPERPPPSPGDADRPNPSEQPPPHR